MNLTQFRPQNTIVRSQIYFHRFYQCISMKEYETFLVCIACIFLSSKIDDKIRRITEILRVFIRIEQRETDKEENIKYNLDELKEVVFNTELTILGFYFIFKNYKGNLDFV
jgi:hypothetical protein